MIEQQNTEGQLQIDQRASDNVKDFKVCPHIVWCQNIFYIRHMKLKQDLRHQWKGSRLSHLPGAFAFQEL